MICRILRHPPLWPIFDAASAPPATEAIMFEAMPLFCDHIRDRDVYIAVHVSGLTPTADEVTAACRKLRELFDVHVSPAVSWLAMKQVEALGASVMDWRPTDSIPEDYFAG